MDLLPCPMPDCGCDQIQIEERRTEIGWAVRRYCRMCRWAGPDGHASSKEEAFRIADVNWNTRPQRPELTDAQCDKFRRLPCSFNDMVRAIYKAGHANVLEE